jgi:cobalt-zinc-cadmium efflux system membrane fusion protein
MKPLHVLLAFLLGLCACKREAPAPEEGQDPERRAAASAHHEGEERNLVHIDPEMLRDLRVTTAPVQERPGGEGVTALGELGVNEEAYAEVASPVSARVLALLASPGQRVKKGQPLVELQSPELGKARAALQSAQARVSAARQAAERKRTLGAERIVAQKDVQAAEAEAATAEAELAAARAELLALGVEAPEAAGGRGSAAFTLRSPVEGTVIERHAVVGQMAEPTRALFHVGDLSRLWLTVHAFERDAVRIQRGARARVTFTALPGKDFAAKVEFIGQRVEPASRTIPVRLELDNPDGVLRPGMSASAFIPLDEPGALVITVPAAALQRLEDGWFAFLPRAEGTFERRAVGRGRTLGGDVEVLAGLKAGEQVVVEGAFLLKAEVEKSRGEGEEHGH